ncbi:SMC-Scp complex subunit ScpB [Candidatus Marinimicrobia bacterium]|nr:SMC-Scp complex subunit ScpB [Candidatus Neomarinimicrobiota bacterium]
MTKNQKIIESLFFVSTVPLIQKDLIKVFGKDNAPDLEKEVSNLNSLYEKNSFYIKSIGEGFMMVSKKDFEPYISKLIPTKKLMLSNAALEVLAIIAYKQPISRIQIETIRGVDCKGVIKNLLSKNLIKIQGRDDSIGKALLYKTTDDYLKHFGISNLSEMPTSDEVTELVESEHLS